MLQRCTFGALLLALGLVAQAFPQTGDGLNKRIGELIEKLGSDHFQERSAAQKELETIGVPALEQLKKSIATSDLETSKRAGELVRRIEDKHFTTSLLAPKRVHLKVTDMPTLDVVEALAKLSGYPIQVVGDRSKVGDKKITLDTGVITFWKAFDILCAEAGLKEKIQADPQEAAVTALTQGQINYYEVDQSQVKEPGIILLPGTPKNRHVAYGGSVRSRVHFLSGGNEGEYCLSLEAFAEPRIKGFTIIGTPTIEKGIDDQGQQLFLKTEPTEETIPNNFGKRRPGISVWNAMQSMVYQRQINLLFPKGKKQAKSIQRLSGSFTAQVTAPPEALFTIPNVLKASGESVAGKNGGKLQINAVEKIAPGEFKVQIYLESPLGPNAMGGAGGAIIMANGMVRMQRVQFQVGFNGGQIPFNTMQGLPELLDSKGNKFKIVQVPARRLNFNNGLSTQEMTIVFRNQNDQGEPDRLILTGSRTVNVTIPFAFENVALEK